MAKQLVFLDTSPWCRYIHNGSWRRGWCGTGRTIFFSLIRNRSGAISCRESFVQIIIWGFSTKLEGCKMLLKVFSRCVFYVEGMLCIRCSHHICWRNAFDVPKELFQRMHTGAPKFNWSLWSVNAHSTFLCLYSWDSPYEIKCFLVFCESRDIFLLIIKHLFSCFCLKNCWKFLNLNTYLFLICSYRPEQSGCCIHTFKFCK